MTDVKHIYMKTYTPEHIQECARFIEKNCFKPTILYSNHQYANSEIYKTILGRYCVELNAGPTLTPGHTYNETDFVDPAVYINNWLDRYSAIDKHNIEYLESYLKNNTFNYNLEMRRIVTHNKYRSATIDIRVLPIKYISIYEGSKRGFSTEPLEVYAEQNGTWRSSSSIIHIIKVCAELMDQTLIDALNTIKLDTLNLGIIAMYNGTPVVKSAFSDVLPISDTVKLNVFVLYSKLNNMEFDISKKNIIDLAINLNMTLEQTLEMYKHHSAQINICDYPEIS